MTSNTIDLKYVVDSTQLKEANRELNRTDDALRRTGSLANSSGKKMNKFGVAMQQTGYQVGDFLVQVQSGQNALVAFGQQATQLVGILPMFNSFMGLSGTALVGLSAGLGVAIPLVTAIGAAIMRAGKDAKSLAEEFEGLSEAIKGYETIAKLASASTKQLSENFGNLAKEATFAIKELQALKLLKLDEEFDKIANAFTDVSEVSGRVSGNIAKNYRDFFGLKSISSEAIPEIINLQKSLEDAVSLEDKTQAATGLAEAISRITGGVNNMTQEQKAYYETVLSAAKELASISEEERKDASSGFEARQQAVLEGIEIFRSAQKRMREEERKDAEARQQAVLEGIEIFRSAQKRMREEEARTQAEIAKGYANSVGQAQTIKNATAQYQQEMIGVFKTAKSLKKELGEAAYEALRLSGVDISSERALAEYEAGQKIIAERKAWTEEAIGIFRAAQKRMRDEDVAITERTLEYLFRNRTLFYSIRFSGEQEVMSQSLTPSGRMSPSQSYEELIAMGWTPEDLERIGLTPPRKPSGGRSFKKQDPLAKLKAQLKLERDLVGVSEERARIINTLGMDFVKDNPKIVEGLEAQILKTKELTELEEKRQGIIDTVESSMKDNFMAMVEGTKSVKDAFKGMARDIIKELYRVLVVQEMVGSFDKSNPSKNSGILGFAGELLTGISGKASGGTVQANQPYLVGEKGPEIIVPRNRGHVMNADLTANAMGGGETVVVNQSFNFQANGDESVKKIIAQAVPSIANMAKQAVMDARRRGGAMKNTFG
jgi:hypothetical protein